VDVERREEKPLELHRPAPGNNGLRQARAQPPATVVTVDVHVAELAEGRTVGCNARVGNLGPVTGEHPEVQGVSRRGLDGLAGAPERPEGIGGQPLVHTFEIHPSEVRVDLVVISPAVGHHLGILSAMSDLAVRQRQDHEPAYARRAADPDVSHAVAPSLMLAIRSSQEVRLNATAGGQMRSVVGAGQVRKSADSY